MNFYTSSSKYLIVLGVLFALYMAFSIWTNMYVEAKGLAKDNERLLFVQLEKIKNTKGVEIALVGDSSLGNSIDAKLVEKLTGKKTLNLALTGSFGYSGSYNMARRVYDANKDTLKFIVIEQTLDVAGRGVSADLYRKTECITCSDSLPVLLSSLTDKTFFTAYFNSWIDAFINKNYVQSRWKRIHPPEKKKVTDTEGQMDYDPKVDYYGQLKLHPLGDDVVKDQNIPTIYASSKMYLRFLKSFCDEKKITCVYLHGPIYAPLGRKYAGYREVLETEIEKNFGKPVAGGPYMMEKKEVGDSLDHVRPKYKDKTTKFYLEKIFR